jgi:hypothetical protein
VFSKDMATYVTHMADDDFLDRFRHTVLIRDPAQSLPSMYDQWDEFTIGEAGYEDLHLLFDAVIARYNQTPPVIDSDDLVDDPRGTVQAYCAAVGIEFMPEALDWEPGDRAEVRWYGGSWHDNLATSTGLQKHDTSDRASIGDVPFLSQMYEACRPHYEAMALHKLAPVS